MSRIYFHSPSETVEVHGSERAHLAHICSSLSAGVLNTLSLEQKCALLPDSLNGRARRGVSADEIEKSFRQLTTWFSDRRFADGNSVKSVTLNTALRVGSRSIALAARIDAQCEIHGFVEPEDGEFIASLIETGLRSGVFRETLPLNGEPTDELSGWREACRVLRAGETVVTSFSMCSQFPNPWVVIEQDLWTPPPSLDDGDSEGDTDAFYELPASEQWRLGLQALRQSDKGLRWAQEDWDDFYFDYGASALDYLTAIRTEPSNI